MFFLGNWVWGLTWFNFPLVTLSVYRLCLSDILTPSYPLSKFRFPRCLWSRKEGAFRSREVLGPRCQQSCADWQHSSLAGSASLVRSHSSLGLNASEDRSRSITSVPHDSNCPVQQMRLIRLNYTPSLFSPNSTVLNRSSFQCPSFWERWFVLSCELLQVHMTFPKCERLVALGTSQASPSVRYD